MVEFPRFESDALIVSKFPEKLVKISNILVVLCSCPRESREAEGAGVAPFVLVCLFLRVA